MNHPLYGDVKVLIHNEATTAPGAVKFNQCFRKKYYPSKPDADIAVSRLMDHPDNYEPQSPLHSYYCEFCGGYHVGHNRKREKR